MALLCADGPPSAGEGKALLLDHAQAGRNDPGIELDPGVLTDLGQGRLHAQRGTVGPMRAHRLDDVGHGKDPGFQQGVFAEEPPG